MSKPLVLLIDDDSAFVDSLEEVLGNLYDTLRANTIGSALALLREKSVEAILLDIDFGGKLDGLQYLPDIINESALAPVIMLTGNQSTDAAVQATRAGAFDYCTKPIDRTRLLTTLRNAIDKCLANRTKVELINERKQQHPLIGSSEVMKKIRDRIARIAQSEETVLITGETGTGKEVVARQIHYHSRRAGQRFIAVNMAGIPNELMEAELFGYLKGAFTGAFESTSGYFGAAKGGTIFLDEIGLASLAAQSKLLRAVEMKEYTPLKATTPVSADIRIVAATSRNLDSEMKAGRFLPDLYYRLNAFSVHIPALREHKSDAIELFNHFMLLKADELGVSPKQLTPEARIELTEYPWPGNVRDVKHLVEKSLVLSDQDNIDSDELRELVGSNQTRKGPAASSTLAARLRDCEREIISSALAANNFNRTATAASLGIHRVTLQDKLKDLGLEQINR
ncbi:MAG: sigma-54-dependent Fis family transcriptional regulator [candidate division Zixibacteria bacterium]|nr:sigma-54-dependent Fis family transcriptional regulator [candidate division Zixibacteria bacterium]